ncbi:MAG TPA: hypothetical protein VKE22_00475 [Haliangiales bacterium]|nr:hypothetical protein [Haliangiales bacterium]
MRPVREAAAVLLTLLAGCDTAIHFGGEGPDAAPSGKCVEAERHSDFPWIRDNVLKVSCSAFSACHQGTRPAGKLNLTPAQAYDQLVNVPAQEPGWVRVVPGDPMHSYVMVKIGAAPGPLGDGGLMPPNSVLLCAQKMDAIRRWIAAGAPPDPSAPDGGPSDARPHDAPISDGAVVD